MVEPTKLLLIKYSIASRSAGLYLRNIIVQL